MVFLVATINTNKVEKRRKFLYFSVVIRDQTQAKIQNNHLAFFC